MVREQVRTPALLSHSVPLESRLIKRLLTDALNWSLHSFHLTRSSHTATNQSLLNLHLTQTSHMHLFFVILGQRATGVQLQGSVPQSLTPALWLLLAADMPFKNAVVLSSSQAYLLRG